MAKKAATTTRQILRHWVPISGPDVTATLVCPGCSNPLGKARWRIGNTQQCSCGDTLEAVYWRMVQSPVDLQAYIDDAKAHAPSTSFDWETTHLDPHQGKIVGVSFGRADQPGVAIYVPMRHKVGQNMDPEVVKEICAPFISTHPMNAHNALFEYLWALHEWGVEININCCTKLLAWLDNPNRGGREMRAILGPKPLAAKSLARELWGVNVTDFEELVDVKRGLTFADVGLQQAWPYGCQDSEIATRLLLWRHAEVMSKQPTIYRMEHELIPVAAKMQLRGIYMDAGALAETAPALEDAIERMERDVFRSMGFKSVPLEGPYEKPLEFGSPAQLANQLFNVMGLPYDKRSVGKPSKFFPTGQPSTDKETLEDLEDEYEICKDILALKGAQTLSHNFVNRLSDYVSPITGFIHGSFNQAGGPTGRFSHNDPNLAQIPKDRS